MRGQHAAPRHGATAPEIVLAAMAAPAALALAVAASLAAGVLCGAFLLLLGVAWAAVRVPPRPALWVLAFGCWPAYSLVFAHWAHEAVAGGITSGACLAALAWLRAMQRRQFRETGGRAFNPKRDAGVQARPSLLLNAARLDALEEWQQEIEGLRKRNGARLDALAGIVREAHEAEGLPVPEALQVSMDTMPLPLARLRLVWDARRTRGA